MTDVTKSREIALDILTEVLEKDAFTHQVLFGALDKYQYLKKPDRAFITRLVNGVVERLLTIDAVIDSCSSVKVAKMKPVIRTILRMSVYQILWMDRIPDRAVCSEALKLAASRHFGGLKGFVNGVLREIARQKVRFPSGIKEGADWQIQYSMPQWLIDMWKEAYDDDTVEHLLQAFFEDGPLAVRCNKSLASVDESKASLESQGVKVSSSPLTDQVLLLEQLDYLEGLEAFKRGWITPQDTASVLAGLAASPQPGDRIVDVCGAPGGKSLHMADCLAGTGLVLLRDLTEEKVALARENIARAGFANIQAQVWDARELDERLTAQADIVIADLPCSGLGVIGKKPDIKYRVSAGRIEELAMLQRQILSVAAQYVKPGGKLIYSTCTISRRENEEQRQWFLANFPFTAGSLDSIAGPLFAEKTLEEGYVPVSYTHLRAHETSV